MLLVIVALTPTMACLDKENCHHFKPPLDVILRPVDWERFSHVEIVRSPFFLSTFLEYESKLDLGFLDDRYYNCTMQA